jgi:hypothetical protein
MVMEKILNDTKDIHPLFWSEFSSSECEKLLKNIELEDDGVKKNLSELFDLLLFVISNFYKIYEDNCDSYLDILNMLCIYSTLSREINLILVKEITDKEDLNEIMIEFINITSIIIEVDPEINILLDDSGKEDEKNKIFLKKINSSKSRAIALFNKIIKIV